MSGLAALADRWDAEAQLLERYSDERGAAVTRHHADELRRALRERGESPLTLTEASRESGYSEDHLRHLVASGVIPNAGRKGSPRIRRDELPLKPGRDPQAVEAAAIDLRERIRGSAR